MPFIDKFFVNCSHRLRSLNIATLPKIKYSLNEIIRRGKDKVLNKDQTNVVYEVLCNDCDASYVGGKKRALIVRAD